MQPPLVALIEIKITLGIVLVIVFLGGVICNVAVLVLPPPRWTKNMKTGNKLIKSLHAIDLIICICLMPITFSVLMHSPEVSENLCFLTTMPIQVRKNIPSPKTS
jgi:hypothetical protein